jgi:hypothetical protein
MTDIHSTQGYGLKTCPSCLNDAFTFNTDNFLNIRVFCSMCGIAGPPSSIDCDTIELQKTEAVIAWNGLRRL